MTPLRITRLLLRVPMAMPLLGIVGALLGAWGWLLAGVAVALACAARAWRSALLTLLAAAVSGLHVQLLTELAEPLQTQGSAVSYTGVVTRTMAHGVFLDAGWLQPAVWVHGELPAALGDEWEVLAVPTEPEARPLIPGGFDRARWLRSEGVAAELDVIEAHPVAHPWSWAALRGAGMRLRMAAERRIMPPGTEHDLRHRLLCALLLGDRGSAGEEATDLFRRGGCLHVFAVSGLHVGIIAGFCWGLFRMLRVRPVVARPLILLLLALYVLLTGAAVPALRAYAMLFALLGAQMLRQRFSAANTWCAAAALTLLAAPGELYSAGFLLSFGVYAAIGLGVGLCLRVDRPWFGPDAYLPYRIMTTGELRCKAAELWLRSLVLVSLSAWLMALPITLLMFRTVNPYAVFCNIALAVPLTLCMAAGLAYLIGSGVPLLGAAAQWAAQYTAGLLLSIVAWFGGLPGAYLPAAPPAAPDTVLELPARYGCGCCLLGNPGLLIGSGSESYARFELIPALFFSGCRPAALLELPVADSQRSGAAELRHQYPSAAVVSSDQAQWVSTEAGRFLICPPPQDVPLTPAQNKLPLILWVQPSGRRVLYMGDASALSLRALPPEERRADVLLLGRNPTAPLTQQDAEELGNPEIRQLP